MVKKLSYLFYTLKYLKPTQLVFFILRRKLPASNVNVAVHAELGEKSGRDSLAQPISLTGSIDPDASKFSFLNVDQSFPNGEVDWSASGLSRLWGYNLHYFDYLRDEACNSETGYSLIHHWVDRNPQGSEPGWEPFTTSLRIVNWIFFLSRNPEYTSQEILNSLYLQTLWLEKNDERHILANHYFENLKALAFAGAYFKGKDAERWLRNGQNFLLEQLQEQVLSDGGHYERSPHYHLLMLENYLDIYNLGVNNTELLSEKCLETTRKAAVSGLEFLHDVLMPDGTIPLFNDSVNTHYPNAEKVFEYAERLGVYSRPASSEGLALIQKESSGFYGYRSDRDMLLIDCGDIGPSYQPGHTHCDFLSYELMVNQQRVIVDTGVFEYSPGEMRHYVRSTGAHNTVSVDKQEQSEIWGEFRVARRAQKLQANIQTETTDDGDEVCFEGSFKGFPSLRAGIEHSRKLTAQSVGESKVPNVWKVEDTISGKGEHLVESFVHFHPDFEIKTAGSGCFELTGPDGLALQIEIDSNAEAEITDSWFCPDFGLKCANKVMIVHTTQKLPVKLGYSIKRM